MYDLTVKDKSKIKIGDTLMGEDGTPRRVLDIKNSKGVHYEITQIKGISYTVYEDDKLSLCGSTKFLSRSIKYTKGQIVNITASLYNKETGKFMKHTKGYKATLTKLSGNTVINPYLLGLWLADGTSATAEITVYKNDIELLNYLRGNDHGYMVHERDETSRNNCFLIGLKSGFRYLLKENNLLRNKHIPYIYKSANYNQRLELLSGLLDGDGYLCHNGYEIVTKFPKLAEDIIYIARSLGFSVSVADKFSKCQNFEGAYYKRIFISGDTDKLVCKLPRKRATSREQRKQPLSTGISIKESAEVSSFNFVLEGGNLYCLSDFTVVHGVG